MSKEKLTKALGVLLADTFVLYVKTLNYHWHVKGPWFQSLHILFEGQYIELAAAIDEIAEHIRSLGAQAPATIAQYLEITQLSEPVANPKAMGMVKELRDDHNVLAENALNIISIAQNLGQEATVELLSGRQGIHEKQAWMLDSSLED